MVANFAKNKIIFLKKCIIKIFPALIAKTPFIIKQTISSYA